MRNSGKSAKLTKTQKIPRNSVEILSNTCLYNIFETYFSYWGYLLAVNLQIYLRTSWLKRANNILKLLLKTLVWSAKTNWFLAKFVLKITTKSAVFYRLLFDEVCPENSHKITAKSADFSANLSLKIQRNLSFSSVNYHKPWNLVDNSWLWWIMPRI